MFGNRHKFKDKTSIEIIKKRLSFVHLWHIIFSFRKYQLITNFKIFQLEFFEISSNFQNI